MILDIPGRNGEVSTSDYYSHRLAELGLRVQGDHYHWKGSTVFQNDKLINAIHHSSTQHSPEDFSRLTIQAIMESMDLIEERALIYGSDEHC